MNCEQDLAAYVMQPLMLQSIVENAIMHGFKNVKKEKEIVINVYENGKDIFISVWDNGVGIEKKKLSVLWRI